MKAYILQINNIKKVYNSEDLAKKALSHFISENSERPLINNHGELIYKIYTEEVLHSYIVLLINPITGDKIWEQGLNTSLKDFEAYIRTNYKDYYIYSISKEI